MVQLLHHRDFCLRFLFDVNASSALHLLDRKFPIRQVHLPVLSMAQHRLERIPGRRGLLGLNGYRRRFARIRIFDRNALSLL
jgi:hypothetical protein